MKKISFILIILIILSISNIYADDDLQIVFNKTESYVRVIGSTNEKILKVIVEKDGINNWADINIDKGKVNQYIYLNQGAGKYTFKIVKYDKDNKYKVIKQYYCTNEVYLNPYLSSENHIESNNIKIIEQAKYITKNCKTDTEKVVAIYKWIQANITYDFDKLKKHEQGDYNNSYGALATLQSRKGVCYDYATLLAALTRSLGIETKLLKKYIYLNGEVTYHAWNEVYLDGEWVTFDATP